MSDPVTNVAIEDVLSSIRRLVSEDARVQPVAWRPDPVEDARPAEAPAAAGRLVLTPALRVTGEAEAEVQGDDAPAPQEALVLHSPEEAAAEPANQGDATGDHVVAWAEDTPDGVEDAPADVVAEDHHQDAGEAGDAADPYVLGAAEAEVMAWEDHHDDAPQGGDATDGEGLDAGGFDAGRSDAGGSDEYLAAEDVTMPEPEDLSQDAPDSGFVFASTRDGHMREEAPVPPLSEARDGAGSADRDDNDLFLRDDEAVLDEDSLRELVAEIVRQELQGALGERITRNVRKLVRREIHRALTSHELE
ncbi:MAG: hypothetical protein ACU0A4_12710 [Paracoccaceae bacterium]